MRLIDADALAQGIRAEGINQAEQSPSGRADPVVMAYGHCYDMVRSAPTIDPVRHGHWIGVQTTSFLGLDDYGDPKYADRKFYRCSECRFGSAVRHCFCPHCGAKMDEEVHG